MRTIIHVTKKLEKLIKSSISNENSDLCGKLGKWNAAVFFLDRKKCWLVTNGLSQYNVILTDIKSTDLKGIEEMFKNALFSQLIFDGILIDFNNLSELIGRLDFYPTDNDRKTTGFQNQRIEDLNYWRIEFGGLANMPINDLTNRINKSPIHLGKSRKMADYTDSITEMRRLCED